MKKISAFIMLAAAAIAASVSCTQEPKINDNPEGTIRLSVKTSAVDVKTSFDGTDIYWKDGDKITVFSYDDVNIATVDVLSETNIAYGETSKTATFAGSVPAAGTYYALYPDFYSYGNTVNVQFPADQVQQANGSFDGNADILVSKPFEVADESEVTVDDLEFARLSAYLQFYFVNATGDSDLDSEEIVSLSVTSSADLVGDFAVDLQNASATLENGVKTVNVTYEAPGTVSALKTYVGVYPQTFPAGTTFNVKAKTAGKVIEKTVTLPSDIVLEAGHIRPFKLTIQEANVSARGLKIKEVWAMRSGASAWNVDFGGTPASDRNIAMDDNYVYVTENTAAPKVWAIDIKDPSNVNSLPITAVSGQTHGTSCVRIIKNTASDINDGKDVVAVSSLNTGGDPVLYLYDKGIDNQPSIINLVSYTSSRLGDVFTVYGSLQRGMLLFGKAEQGGDGVVTFNLAIKDKDHIPGNIYLNKRIAFPKNDQMRFIAYYPFPESISSGIFIRRGVEERGKSVVFEATDDNFYTEENAVFTPTLTDLDYADGRNGFVLGYNFIEYLGKRWVIYGKQPGNQQGFVYLLKGEADATWLSIANTAGVTFRRDMFAQDGCTLSSGNSGMDVAARVIDGELYIASQKQSIGCFLWKVWED